jgi:hypothetical protein
MDVIKYDFESALEQGFKSLFSAASFTLLIADDYEEGEIPDEALLLTVDVGGVIEEKRNSENIYDHYSASVEIETRTHRVNSTAATDARFKSRHNELVANARKLIEEIPQATIEANWAEVAPTQIMPSGTERENDESHRMTTLSYSVQFRVT